LREEAEIKRLSIANVTLISLRGILTLFVASVLIFLSLSPTHAIAADVIVNNSVSDQLREKDLRFIFSMKRRQWSDGTAISVFVLPAANDIHKKFCKEKLGIYPHQLEAVWYRLVYSGMGKAPIKVLSKEQMVEMVSTTPGAIGYIDTYVENDTYKIIDFR